MRDPAAKDRELRCALLPTDLDPLFDSRSHLPSSHHLPRGLFRALRQFSLRRNVKRASALAALSPLGPPEQEHRRQGPVSWLVRLSPCKGWTCQSRSSYGHLAHVMGLISPGAVALPIREAAVNPDLRASPLVDSSYLTQTERPS